LYLAFQRVLRLIFGTQPADISQPSLGDSLRPASERSLVLSLDPQTADTVTTPEPLADVIVIPAQSQLQNEEATQTQLQNEEADQQPTTASSTARQSTQDATPQPQDQDSERGDQTVD
jgi:hypothetical protein